MSTYGVAAKFVRRILTCPLIYLTGTSRVNGAPPHNTNPMPRDNRTQCPLNTPPGWYHDRKSKLYRKKQQPKVNRAKLLPSDLPNPALLRSVTKPTASLKRLFPHLRNHIWFAAQYHGLQPGLVSRFLHFQFPVDSSSDGDDQSGSFSDESPQVLPIHSRDSRQGLPIPMWTRISWICRSLPVDLPHPHCYPYSHRPHHMHR